MFEGLKAVGMRYLQGGARREVIFCCGTVNSPKVLQLSGGGDRSLFRQYGIPVIHEAGPLHRPHCSPCQRCADHQRALAGMAARP
jgi:choline dehydrogenase-like flavoprotein